jgi:hypothetical protein
MNERQVQTVLMWWFLQLKNHEITIPNATVFYPWEADVTSVTKAGYSHEAEIKISRADFLKDKNKVLKHNRLRRGAFDRSTTPNYFWYATPEGFDIEPPDHAGWLLIVKTKDWYDVVIKKEAPLLHKNKVPAQKYRLAARLMSFRLETEYVARMAKPALEPAP